MSLLVHFLKQFVCFCPKGLVTLEQMKEKRDSLVKEREMQIAAALAAAKRCALNGVLLHLACSTIEGCTVDTTHKFVTQLV